MPKSYTLDYYTFKYNFFRGTKTGCVIDTARTVFGISFTISRARNCTTTRQRSRAAAKRTRVHPAAQPRLAAVAHATAQRTGGEAAQRPRRAATPPQPSTRARPGHTPHEASARAPATPRIHALIATMQIDDRRLQLKALLPIGKRCGGKTRCAHI